MPLYEHVFIARQDISGAQVEGLINDFTEIVTGQGGTIQSHEYWGLKTMAYRIKKNRKGHYVMMNIDAPSAAIAELERNQRIHEDVLRNLTLRVDAFEDGPSVMMQGKRDGDRRGGRGDRDRGDRDRGDRDRGDRDRGDRDRGDRGDRDRGERREGDSRASATDNNAASETAKAESGGETAAATEETE